MSMTDITVLLSKTIVTVHLLLFIGFFALTFFRALNTAITYNSQPL